MEPGLHIQQYAYASSPADTFSRAGLFKISKKPGTDYYIIRSMLNNLLSFGFSGNEVLTKTIPADDASVALSDTFTITYVNTGYVIKPYESSYGVCANDTTASGAAGAPASYLAKRIISSAGNRAIWAFEKYTGANQSGVTVKSDSIISKGFVVDTSCTIRVYTWTTLINANQPYAEIASSDSEIMTGVWNATTNAITITGKKVGKFCLYYRIRSGNNTVRTFYSNFLCIPPIEDGVNYFIQNVATKKYMDVEGPSTAEGAIIQQWKYSTANQKKWIFTRTTDGYFTIKSRYSNKYVGVDSTNTSVIRQYASQSNYTLWYFVGTDSGNYALHCKASAVTGVLASPSDTVDNGEDLTTTAYTDDTNYRDEWNCYVSNYSFSILHSYDQGYAIRFSDMTNGISSYQAVCSEVLLKLFGVTTDVTIEDFTSCADTCTGVPPTFEDTKIDCNHSNVNSKHKTRSFMRTDFVNRFGGGNSTTTKAIWTGHVLESRSSNSSSSTHSIVLTIGAVTNGSDNNLSDDVIRYERIYTLLHELSHQLGAPDHYCYDLSSDNCNNPTNDCWRCDRNLTEEPSCLMSERMDDIEYRLNSGQVDTIYCSQCMSATHSKGILTHLDDHHN